MLQESQIFNFLDQDNNFTLHFFDGQKVIHDLAIIHNLTGVGFSFFRDAVLAIEPLTHFLKASEGFGLFIDSDEPHFRFKLETNSYGRFRTLLLPDTFNKFPSKIFGICRLTKILPDRAKPYNSIVEIDGLNLEEITNKVLKDSYQIDSQVIISNHVDQSVLITRLPTFNKGNALSTTNYINKFKKIFSSALEIQLTNPNQISSALKELNLEYIGNKPIKFHCPCSKENFIHHLLSLQNFNVENLFEDKSIDIQISCEYCKKNYSISFNEVQTVSKQ